MTPYPNEQADQLYESPANAFGWWMQTTWNRRGKTFLQNLKWAKSVHGFWSYGIWVPDGNSERSYNSKCKSRGFETLWDLILRSHKVSKPWDLYLELYDRSEIWQAPLQQYCRCACQISKRYDNLNYQSRGFETSRDLSTRRLIVVGQLNSPTTISLVSSKITTVAVLAISRLWRRMLGFEIVG